MIDEPQDFAKSGRWPEEVNSGLWVGIDRFVAGGAKIRISDRDGRRRRLSPAQARGIAADLRSEPDAEEEEERMAAALEAAAAAAETLKDWLGELAAAGADPRIMRAAR